MGIDAEPNVPLRRGVLQRIALPDEVAHVRRLAADNAHVSWDRLLFSAKEAVYKACFPLTGVRLSFLQARLVLDPELSCFSAALLDPGPIVNGLRIPSFHGMWMVVADTIVTAVVVVGAAHTASNSMLVQSP